MCDILFIFLATRNAAYLVTRNQFLNALTQTFIFRSMLLLATVGTVLGCMATGRPFKLNIDISKPFTKKTTLVGLLWLFGHIRFPYGCGRLLFPGLLRFGAILQPMAKWLSLEHIKQWLHEVEPVSWHAGQTFLLDVGPVFGTLLVEEGLSVLSFFWFAFKSFTALVRDATLACNNCTVAAKSFSCFLSLLLLWENSELAVSTPEILDETWFFFWVNFVCLSASSQAAMFNSNKSFSSLMFSSRRKLFKFDSH